jgi:site-specific DNA-methyltransferase (adenine-specific)
MTLIEAIRTFFRRATGPVHVQDLYAAMPDEHEHSIRARIYERLGREFHRVGRGLYVARDESSDVTCVVACDDAWRALRDIPSRFVDAVVTDPPYPWIDKHIGKGTTRPRMRWTFEKKEVDKDLGLEIWRVLKKGAHCFVFVPAETPTTRPHVERLIRLLESCGLRFNKRWIWDKVHPGMGYSGRGRYEGILFMSKGEKRQPCDLSIPDVLSCPLIPASRRRHPTEKPVEVLKKIIRFATKAGELVLDPFAGSCSTGRAALALGRNSILIEKNEAILEGALS